MNRKNKNDAVDFRRGVEENCLLPTENDVKKVTSMRRLKPFNILESKARKAIDNSKRQCETFAIELLRKSSVWWTNNFLAATADENRNSQQQKYKSWQWPNIESNAKKQQKSVENVCKKFDRLECHSNQQKFQKFPNEFNEKRRKRRATTTFSAPLPVSPTTNLLVLFILISFSSSTFMQQPMAPVHADLFSAKRHCPFRFQAPQHSTNICDPVSVCA